MVFQSARIGSIRRKDCTVEPGSALRRGHDSIQWSCRRCIDLIAALIAEMGTFSRQYVDDVRDGHWSKTSREMPATCWSPSHTRGWIFDHVALITTTS